MTQEIVTDYPPIYDEIASRFDLHPSDSIIFSWGDRIYNPMNVTIGPELIAHEAVHGDRQSNDPGRIKAWWTAYLLDTPFRLSEEMYAHRAEYQWLVNNGNRKQRRSALKHTSNRLAAPLYGSMITPSAAKDILRTH
jgi:hypothetical protein